MEKNMSFLIVKGRIKGKVASLLSFIILLSFFVISLLFFVGLGISQQQEGGKISIKRPPKSLDNFYPPKSREKKFLAAMHNMATSFKATMFYLQAGNTERAKKWAENLVKSYIGIKDMVPEWQSYIKKDVAENFLKAVSSGDLKQVGALAKELGDTCKSCHQDNQLSTKIFYSIPSWDDIELEDPVSLKKVGVHKFMQELSDSLRFTLIGVQDGDFSLAEKSAKDFSARAKALKETCSSCHTSKASIEALAGKDYTAAVDALFSAVKEKNSQKFFSALSRVGDYCTRCHTTHLLLLEIKEAISE